MEFSINWVFDGAQAVAAANHPTLRLFTVAHRLAFAPVDDYAGTWVVCTPENLKKSDFSAVAYFFAQEILADRQVPIGVIGSYWGGSSQQAWTSVEALRSDPSLKPQLDRVEKTAANLPVLWEKYEKEILPAFQAQHDAWKAEVGDVYTEALAQWNADNKQALAEKRPPPAKPIPSKPEPYKPHFEGDDNHLATTMYNGMIAPLGRAPVKGVVWYQGEGNAGRPAPYARLLATLIADLGSSRSRQSNNS